MAAGTAEVKFSDALLAKPPFKRKVMAFDSAAVLPLAREGDVTEPFKGILAGLVKLKKKADSSRKLVLPL